MFSFLKLFIAVHFKAMSPFHLTDDETNPEEVWNYPKEVRGNVKSTSGILAIFQITNYGPIMY